MAINTDTINGNDNVITLKQSQKLVHTLLVMSFGCITYLRGLFDEKCYNDQKYYPNKSDPDSTREKTNSIRVKTLIRGKSSKVDKLLDWLDKGVFPLIASKYLKAFSLAIYVDDPLDLLECYTFSFEYQEDGVKMQLGDTECSLLDTRQTIEQLMRKLIILTQSFPSLPTTRKLGLRLFFNDSCPLDYQPSELFRDISEKDQPKISIDKLDLQGSEGLQTPYHQLEMKILNSSFKTEGSENYILIDPFELVDDDDEMFDVSSVPTTNKKKLLFHKPILEPETSQVTSELESFLKQRTRSSIGQTQEMMS